MRLSKSNREELRLKFAGKCAYCGCELAENKWHADHLEPVERKTKFVKDARGVTRMVATGQFHRPENDTLANLVPACMSCNIDKSSMPLESWRLQLADLPDCLRRNSPNFRHGERFGLITVLPARVVFWFEKYVSICSDETTEGAA